MNFINQVIIRSVSVAFAFCLLVGLSSCGDGDIGPQGGQGDVGAKGSKGDAGDAGTQGKGYLTKSGSLSGTITGKRSDGTTAINESFTYEYRGDSREVINEGYLGLSRYKDSYYSGEESPYIRLEFQVTNAGTPQESLVLNYAQFVFSRQLDATKLFVLYASYYSWADTPPTVTITNYSHNMTTGVLTFDYEYVDDPAVTGGFNSTENLLTIKGKFTSGTGKVYSDVVNRKGT